MPTEPIKPKRSVHRTQWAAQFAVASELCKKGYEVAFTMGNHPDVDLMVTSPDKQSFFIDVKGQYTKNFWLITRKKPKENLFYVLAFVPDDESNHFFILSQLEANHEIELELERLRAQRIKKNLSIEKINLMPGIAWQSSQKFKDKWKTLPN